eukprot:scaffold2017_cov387-Prasinococcus_capsulatus_cf.AAC.23
MGLCRQRLGMPPLRPGAIIRFQVGFPRMGEPGAVRAWDVGGEARPDSDPSGERSRRRREGRLAHGALWRARLRRAHAAQVAPHIASRRTGPPPAPCAGLFARMWRTQACAYIPPPPRTRRTRGKACGALLRESACRVRAYVRAASSECFGFDTARSMGHDCPGAQA